MAPAEETARFEALLDRCERVRTRGLSFDELTELARAYRAHVARLARLRAGGDDPVALRYVNALCVRAHTLLHVERPRGGRLAEFVRVDVPRAVGRTWAAQVAAWALLAAGMAVGATLGLRDAAAVHALLPAGLGHGGAGLDRLLASPAAREEFFTRRTVDPAMNLFFGSSLFVHNTRVGLLSFAAGMLAGIPTVLLQLYNGLVLGAFSAIFLRDAHPILYLAWILPHGIPELTAITLCAAGGLVVGGAVAAPGRAGRVAALRAAVAPALALLVAALPLFLLAALTESFVRESTLGTAARLGVAAGYAGLLGLGLAWVRRCAAQVPPSADWLGALTRPRGAAADSDRARPR